MFHFKNNEAYCEGVSLRRLAAEMQTPLYVYSLAMIRERCREFREAFKDHPTLICFAVKANSNLTVLKEISQEGLGADVVSGGELERTKLAGVPPEKIVFSGVGKSGKEIELALTAGISCLNVESISELKQIEGIASSLQKEAPISIRVNPNIDVKTNPYIATGLYSTKFGIAEGDFKEALALVKKSKSLRLIGLSCHLGSQILSTKPFKEATRRMITLAKKAKSEGFPIVQIDMGGGLGIKYQREKPPSVRLYAKTLLAELKESGFRLILEPGRAIVGEAGVLLTEVMIVKKTPKKNFIIVDAAMSELIRPALYQGHHEIIPVRKQAPQLTADVVGPVCETGDYLGLKRRLPSLKPGDFLFIANCGAYGMSMASHYNSRPHPAEVLVDGESYRVIRRREKLDALWSSELF
jgi:diaminopimelate decarboxylase